MKSFIILENIEIYAYHGVFVQENLVGNTFILNLKIESDLSAAIDSDDLKHTINYAKVYDLVEREMSIPSKLLEHVGGRIIKALKKEFQEIINIELKISKRNPPVSGQIDFASILLID